MQQYEIFFLLAIIFYVLSFLFLLWAGVYAVVKNLPDALHSYGNKKARQEYKQLDIAHTAALLAEKQATEELRQQKKRMEAEAELATMPTAIITASIHPVSPEELKRRLEEQRKQVVAFPQITKLPDECQIISQTLAVGDSILV